MPRLASLQSYPLPAVSSGPSCGDVSKTPALILSFSDSDSASGHHRLTNWALHPSCRPLTSQVSPR